MTMSLPSPREISAATAWATLVGVGCAWGSGQYLTKIAVSTGHGAIGLAFWQAVIAALCFGAALVLTGRRLPLSRRMIVFYGICGLAGTALPHSLGFTTIKHLPVGVQAIVLTLVPMLTFLLSLPLGLDRAEPRRLLGIGLGLVAMLMIALPEASLPDRSQVPWVLLAMVVPLSYAVENVYLARARPAELDDLQVMCGLTFAALALLVPSMLVTGTWYLPWPVGEAEAALLGTTLLHVCAYFGLVWLIARAGPVFASQVSYIVTGVGVLSGMLFLGERHSLWVWGALALMFVGVTLVRPRKG